MLTCGADFVPFWKLGYSHSSGNGNKVSGIKVPFLSLISLLTQYTSQPPKLQVTIPMGFSRFICQGEGTRFFFTFLFFLPLTAFLRGQNSQRLNGPAPCKSFSCESTGIDFFAFYRYLLLLVPVLNKDGSTWQGMELGDKW